LRLYGSLINGQKAVVTLTGIQIFFDILVPDKEFIDDFKIKIDVILSSVINTYKIEYIKAFPLRGYRIGFCIFISQSYYGLQPFSRKNDINL
jgi:hypothetical protein